MGNRTGIMVDVKSKFFMESYNYYYCLSVGPKFYILSSY